MKWLLTCLLLWAAVPAWAGIRHFREEAGNFPVPPIPPGVPVPVPSPAYVPTTLDPQGWRPLTSGEIRISKKVFQDAVDYSAVRVYNRKWAPVFQPQWTTMSPNGNIYYPQGHPSYRDDLSTADGGLQVEFMHEMTHVYQHQQGVNVIARRLQEGPVYVYKMEPGRDMNDYAVEQQAEMVSEYFKCALQYPYYGEWYCKDKFRPALTRFFEDPKYLREAELKRLRAKVRRR